MTGQSEVIENTQAGAVTASAVDQGTVTLPARSSERIQPACLNCGAPLTGAYCAACAQPAHIHRSLGSLGHDILHSVFHFEGKFWRTLPLLLLHPGQLTRRYIDGERAKFVSPMALFLFAVFLMFAVFSFMDGADSAEGADVQSGHRAAIEPMDRNIAELRTRLSAEGLTADERAAIEDEIVDLESSRAVIQLFSPDQNGSTSETQTNAQAKGSAAGSTVDLVSSMVGVRQLLNQVNENPGLVVYKLKTNGYKFAWALVPMSIPFMWLLFCWRRDIHLYDHAVFVTYSITFMMLFAILSSLLSAVRMDSDSLEMLWSVVPPVHIYRQLRGAYGLSRVGALVRLMFVLIAATIVLSIFIPLLLFIGLLG